MMQACVKRLGSATEYYFQEGCYITELSNSEDDPGLSIARARVEPGATTQLHQLNEAIERYVILQGEGLVALNGQLVEEVFVGDVVIIPSKFSQQITNTGKGDLIFLAICTPRFRIINYREVSN